AIKDKNQDKPDNEKKEEAGDNKEGEGGEKKKKVIPDAHTDIVSSVLFSPDGKTVYSSSLDKTIRFWDATKGEDQQKVMEGHSEYISSMDITKDGRVLATGSGDYRIKLWNIPDKKEMMTLNGHFANVSALVFTPDRNLVSADYNGKIVLW